MRSLTKSLISLFTVFSLLLWLAPAPALASGANGRIEGLLVGVDGRPAQDLKVHLIDGQGKAVAQSSLDGEGLYSFKDLPAGDYSLGIENAEGQMAPVAAPPIELGDAELARRDLKLMQADASTMNKATTANYGLGVWWAGLSPAAKTWTIVAIIAGLGITWSALDDDDEETDGSPSE